MLYVALFAALVAVLGYIPAIPIPFIPVPITAQTLGVMLAGGVLGSKRGGLSMIVLILVALAGAPVLSNGTSGPAHVFGQTGGYILSWPIAAFIIGLLTELTWKKLKVWKVFIFNILGGIIIVYAGGILYMAFVTNASLSAIFLGNLIFIPGDLIKAVIAAVIAVQIKRTYPVIKIKKNTQGVKR